MRHLILTLGLALFSHGAWSQAVSDTAIFKALAAKNNKLPSERIYVHQNKPRYERADTIWFRLYDVTEGHKLSAISHAAYAELIGPKDTVIQRLNLKLEAGMASGDFALPINLPAGRYRIRAYTNWMKNRGEDSYYNREIIIGNPGGQLVNGEKSMVNGEKKVTSITSTTSTTPPTTPDLQFFPEGGDLVEGLRNVVAYKATNPDGSAAMFIGTITGVDNEVLAELQSNTDGMGTFAIKPQANENYFAKLTFANGSTQNIRLPVASASGYALTINNHNNDTLQIKIAANNELLKKAAGQSFYLVAQADGRIYYTTSGKADSTPYKIKIAKDRFPTGITRFTLYAQDGEPLNERVVFIQSKDNLNLKINPKNDNQTIELKATTQKDNTPTIGSFSATVFNEDKVPFDERTEPTITSSLLLSNELHGNISDPNHYLANANAMDLLMLTQGYRKLEWKKADLQSQAQPNLTQYQNEDGLKITGTVTDNKGKPVTGGKVTLISTNPMVKLDTLTTSDGKFAFTGLDIDGKVKFVLKAQNGKSDAVKIQLDNIGTAKASAFMPLRTTAIADTSTGTKALAAAIQNSYKEEEQNYQKINGKQLKEVTIKDKYDPDKKREEELAGSTNLNGPGHADQVVMGKDLAEMGCPLLVECLRSKLAMVIVKADNIYDISRGHSAILGAGPVTVFVDGNIAVLGNVNVNDIYSIELLTSAKYKAIYGHDAAGGLLLITTKKGIAKNEQIPVEREPGLISFTYDGYYKARTFYRPKYRQGDAYQPGAIYWNPEILTDKDGKAAINFNNAGKGHYRVVVEGIDGEGRLGHAEYKYEVK